MENTRFYNILPIDVATDNKRKELVGKVLESCPFDEKDIKWLISNDGSDTAQADGLERLRKMMAQKKPEQTKETTHNDNTYQVIGFWKDGKLHFVHTEDMTECEQEPYSLKLDVFSRNTGILESDMMLKTGVFSSVTGWK